MGVTLSEWLRMAGDSFHGEYDQADPIPDPKPVGRPKKEEGVVAPPVEPVVVYCAMCKKNKRIRASFVPDPDCPGCKAVRMQT